MDFAKNAQLSAQIYYEYLKTSNRGEINYEVTDKEATTYQNVEGYFALKLRGPKVTQLEFLQIQIDNKLCESSCIEIATYIDKENTLVIKPIGNMYPVVKSAHCNQIKVFSDLKFLVKRVEKWYEEHGTLVSIPKVYPTIVLDKENHLINGVSEAQIEAMEGVLSYPFSYVWGAPGTGKTQFVLARLVGLYVEANKRVLITAPTNNAVEQMLRGVLPVLKEAGIEIEKAVLRIGVPSEQFAKEFPGICESSRTARAMRKMQNQILRLKDSIKNNDELLKQYHSYMACREEFKRIESYGSMVESMHASLSECIEKLISTSKTLEIQKRKIQENEEKKQQLETEIERNKVELGGLYVARERYKNGFRAIFYKKKIESTERTIENVLEMGTKYNKEMNAVNTNLALLQQALNKNSETIECLTNEAQRGVTEIKDGCVCAFSEDIKETVNLITVSNYLGRAEMLREQLQCLLESKRAELRTFDVSKSEKDIREELDNLKEELSALNAQYKDISLNVDECMEKCQIIAATIDTCLARITPNMSPHFDHVFLDEAGYSCAIKAATLLAFKSPVTFLGDHMQLPPVCEMNDDKFKEPEFEHVSYWAQSALYVESAISNYVDDFAKQYLSAAPAPFCRLKKFSLKQTFRFGCKLAKVLADDVYDSNFTGNDDHNTNIFYIDACKKSSDEKRTSTGEKYAILEYCKNHPNEEIAILTPYRKQAKLIKDELSHNQMDSSCVYTIHGSQGREWETVLFSVVDTHDMWFVDSYNRRSRGKKLINTAVSRSKRKLIIVADVHYWKNRDGQLIEKLIAVAEKAK